MAVFYAMGVIFDFSWLTSEFRNNYIHCAFETGRASSSIGEDWEAGEIPALPRNCKRGHRNGSLELTPGRPEAKSGLWSDGPARPPRQSLLASQETGAN